jgi:hypothetical protein
MTDSRPALGQPPLFAAHNKTLQLLVTDSESDSEHLDSCQTPTRISAYVPAPISVYSDIDTDIGADFNDTQYRCTPDIGVYPISGILVPDRDIGVH